MTPAPTKAPSRTDDPPGTSRTRDAASSRLRGRVSLSRNGTPGSDPGNAAMSPQRKPTRMPCLTHACTRQPAGAPGSGVAARTRPAESSARRVANAARASSRSASPAAAWSRSMVACSVSVSVVTVEGLRGGCRRRSARGRSAAGDRRSSQVVGVAPACGLSDRGRGASRHAVASPAAGPRGVASPTPSSSSTRTIFSSDAGRGGAMGSR